MGTGVFILLNQPRCLPVPGFILKDGAFVCGRSTHCDFVLPHPTVSRRHAKLHVAGAKIEVVDLDSRNGTFVDGMRVGAALLQPSAVLRFGDVSFVFNEQGIDDDDCGSLFETERIPNVPPASTLDAPTVALSAAQRRVLDLVLEGFVEKQIARRLDISRHTAHNHIRNIYRALGVHSRAELLARLISRTGADGLIGLRLDVPKQL